MNWLRRVMYGRYGFDPLGIALVGLSFLLMALRGIFRGFFGGLLSLLALAALMICYLRAFSRNLDKRRMENDWFMAWWRPIGRWFAGRGAAFRELQDYKHFKCPKCGQKIRIPRGRGKVNITCPGCREQFIRKT